MTLPFKSLIFALDGQCEAWARSWSQTAESGDATGGPELAAGWHDKAGQKRDGTSGTDKHWNDRVAKVAKVAFFFSFPLVLQLRALARKLDPWDKGK